MCPGEQVSCEHLVTQAIRDGSVCTGCEEASHSSCRVGCGHSCLCVDQGEVSIVSVFRPARSLESRLVVFTLLFETSHSSGRD